MKICTEWNEGVQVDTEEDIIKQLQSLLVFISGSCQMSALWDM